MYIVIVVDIDCGSSAHR